MSRVARQGRVSLGVLAARGAAFASRKAGRGGGTSLPGQVARFLDNDILAHLSSRLPHGSIVVAGTNGKTTTSRMLAGILAAGDRRVIHNRAGSNLVQGVTTAFVLQSSWRGVPNGDVGVIETDEAAFPEVVQSVKPRMVVLNNLFRDQLDRYGELDTIAKSWSVSLRHLPDGAVIVYNADDPGLAAVVDGVPSRTVAFGLVDTGNTLDELPHAADSRSCARCGSDLAYRQVYVSHLGSWYCPQCGNARPQLDVRGDSIALGGADSLTMTARRDSVSRTYQVGAPGLYNAYNALAAIAAATELGVPESAITSALASYEPAFGRAQRIEFDGRILSLTLAKNPTGFNEVLRMYTAGGEGLTVPTLIAINDNTQDGRDVSWLWDVDFELLADGNGQLATTGLRGPDMANRLKYAGVPVERITELPENLGLALDTFVASIPTGGEAHILSTYTAMMQLHAILAKRGLVERFWEQ